MIRSAKDLRSSTIQAIDGEIGRVDDLLFDDEHWWIRYFVVDTGGWLTGRKVLVTPPAVASADPDTGVLQVRLSREQVQNSPDIDTDRPISRQREAEYMDYYGYTPYWALGAGATGWGAVPTVVAPVPPAADEPDAPERSAEPHADSHLRSVREVRGYNVQATDEPIGHIEDFLFEEQSWAIRYVVVDTRNWLPGRHVLIPPEWIARVSWAERSAFASVPRALIRESPEYDPQALASPAFHERLERYYRAPGAPPPRV